MKGMALDTIGFIIIALFGVILLIMFTSGSLGDFARNAFCYFYQNVFSKNLEMCRYQEGIPEEVILKPESVEDLSRSIAAYSILCWEDATKSLRTKDTNCYNIRIMTHPGNVSEFNITNILETENGCSILQNSRIVDEGGNEIEYSGVCGEEDRLKWDVYGNVISDQELILIKYSDSLKSIVIKG